MELSAPKKLRVQRGFAVCRTRIGFGAGAGLRVGVGVGTRIGVCCVGIRFGAIHETADGAAKSDLPVDPLTQQVTREHDEGLPRPEFVEQTTDPE